MAGIRKMRKRRYGDGALGTDMLFYKPHLLLKLHHGTYNVRAFEHRNNEMTLKGSLHLWQTDNR